VKLFEVYLRNHPFLKKKNNKESQRDEDATALCHPAAVITEDGSQAYHLPPSTRRN